MDFQKWSAEYAAEAATVKKRIDQLRIQRLNGSCADMLELDRRIAILYNMYLELRHTAGVLAKHPQNRKGA